MITRGKNAIAVQQIIAVRRCTAKKSLPCAASRTHGNDTSHGQGSEILNFESANGRHHFKRITACCENRRSRKPGMQTCMDSQTTLADEHAVQVHTTRKLDIIE
jgi:hypothetical protein